MKVWLKPRKLAAVPVFKISCSGRFLKLSMWLAAFSPDVLLKRPSSPSPRPSAQDWPGLETQVLEVPPMEFANAWESSGRNLLKLLNKRIFQFLLNRDVDLFRKPCKSLVFTWFFFIYFEIFHWKAETQCSVFHCFVVTTKEAFQLVKKKYNSSGEFSLSQGISCGRIDLHRCFFLFLAVERPKWLTEVRCTCIQLANQQDKSYS